MRDENGFLSLGWVIFPGFNGHLTCHISVARESVGSTSSKVYHNLQAAHLLFASTSTLLRQPNPTFIKVKCAVCVASMLSVAAAAHLSLHESDITAIV